MKKIILCICVIPVFYSCYSNRGLNGIETKHSEKMLENDLQRFESSVWKRSGPTTRGEMTYNLFMTHNFVGKSKQYVKDLLGKNTAKFVSHDRPCYVIIYDKKKYYIGFRVTNKKTIHSVMLYQNIDEVAGSKERIYKLKNKAVKYAKKYKHILVKNVKSWKNNAEKYAKEIYTNHIKKHIDKLPFRKSHS